MDRDIKIIVILLIVYVIVAVARRIIGIGAEVSMAPSKVKWVKRIGVVVEFLALAAVFGSIAITLKVYTANEQCIETLKSCTFSGTTDTVGNVFNRFYGNLEWSVENPAEKDKNHKYIVMTGQCYREAAIVGEPELIDVKIIFDARKMTDNYFQFKRLYGFVNGELLNSEGFAALIEDTYGANYDRSDMLNNGVSGWLSDLADLYIDEVNKRLFSGKYISYYYDNNGNSDVAETTKESELYLEKIDGNMQNQEEFSEETHEESETLSEELIDISYIFASEPDEEVSWYSDTTGYYMIPYMDEEIPTVLFTSKNNAFSDSIVFYSEITSIGQTSNGGLVCSGTIFENNKELTGGNNTVEITWDAWETIDYPTVRIIGNQGQRDTFMVAGDYYYWGYLENEDTDSGAEYVFPDSDSRLLTETDVSGRSAEELRIAKNEIYARHGRIFTSEDLKEYFDSKSWYVGSIPADQFSENVFNQTEKDNIAFIQKYIDNPSGAGNDSGYASRGLTVNDPQAIPQIPGTYNYYSDPSDKNSLSMELNIDSDGVYVSFNKDGHQEIRSVDLYNINDQEYVDDTGSIGIYFDDYGRTATYNGSTASYLNGTYVYLPKADR